MRIVQGVVLLGVLLAPAGCGMGAKLGGLLGRTSEAAAPAQPEAVLAAPETVEMAPLLAPAAQSPEALDTTTTAERIAAATPAAGGTALGTTIASLGDPTAAGFWLRTPLVSAPAKGRVVAAGGASAVVELLPLEAAPGAGSQISLSALRVLGLTLTDLPELSVYKL